jgi:hypothetical protein
MHIPYCFKLLDDAAQDNNQSAITQQKKLNHGHITKKWEWYSTLISSQKCNWIINKCLFPTLKMKNN